MKANDQLHAPVALSPGKSPRHPSFRRLGGPRSLPRHCGEEKICYPCRQSNPGRPTHNPWIYRLCCPAHSMEILWKNIEPTDVSQIPELIVLELVVIAMLVSTLVSVSRTLSLFAVLYAVVPDCRHVLCTKRLIACSACSTRFAADPVTMTTCSSYIRED
jgi:hypothetical protein